MSRGRAHLPEILLANEFAGAATAFQAQAAVQTLTLTGLPLAGEVVEINGREYTWVAAAGAVADEVEIGASASLSLDNLIAALNAAAGAGTTYGTGTVINADVTAAAGAGDTMDVTAKEAGEDGNAITVSTDMADGTWGDATLEGGTERLGATIPTNQRTARGWLFARRGAGGSGAVTIANAYLLGQVSDTPGAPFDRIATLGSMDIAAAFEGRGVLVDGTGAFERLAVNSDAIVGDTVDFYWLPLTD